LTSHIHLYPPQDDEREIRRCYLIADRDYLEGIDYYVIKLGIAKAGRFDALATFDGSRDQLKKGVPYLFYDGNQRVLSGETIRLDIDAIGLPANLRGTSVALFTGARPYDPAQRVQDDEVRAAVDGVAEWIRAIRGDEDVVMVVLPEIPLDEKTRYYEHSYLVNDFTVSSGTMVDGQVKVTVTGSTSRPMIAYVTAHVTFEVGVGPDTLDLAIGDGSTDAPVHSQTGQTAGELMHVACTRVDLVNQIVTYKVRYKQSAGAPVAKRESISVIAMEA